jgi:ADP-ribose pyrophosphatase
VTKEHPPWKVLADRVLLDAQPFLRVRVETVELPDGRRIEDYYQLEMPSFVCIYAITGEGRVITYRQYRHGPRRTSLLFPGGHLSPREAPLAAAQRELKEETGYVADQWTWLGGYMVNSNQGGAVSHLFRATGCRQVATPHSDDLEDTEVLFLSEEELLAAAGRGEFCLLTQLSLLAVLTNPGLSAALTRAHQEG